MRRGLGPYLLLLLVLILAAALFWPVLRQMFGSPVELRIAVPTYIGYEPLFYAESKNRLSDSAIKVSLKRLDEIGMIAAGLRNGTLDATMTTVDAAMQQRSAGLPGQIIVITDRSDGADGIVARSDRGCARVDCLQGRSVGLQLGSASHYYLLARLRRQNIDPKAVKIVPLEPDQIAPALLNGNIDGAVTWQPFLGFLRERPEVTTIETTRDSQILLFDVLLVTERSLKAHPEAWRYFLRKWFATVDEIKARPQQFVEYVASAHGFAQSDVAKMYNDMRLLGLDENRVYFSRESTQNVMQTVDEVNAVYGAADVINMRVAREAILNATLIHEIEQGH